jgi:hypothetical protein
MPPKTKVIYIMGWGRNGSTLLANILGQIQGCCSVGEIQAIWEWGLLRNWSCGCRQPFRDCGFWRRVADRLSEAAEEIDAEKWNAVCRKETRSLHAPDYLLSYGRFPPSPERREYLDMLARVYEAVRETSGCPVIVDSSKSPYYGGLLGLIPQIELYIIHLIRDPRAVAYSWSVQKPQPDSPMETMGAARSSILWTEWNASAEWIGRAHPGRYWRVRYEDFIQRPRETVESILRFAHAEGADLPFLTEHSIRLNPTHTVRGNPDRFVTGEVTLVPDVRWESCMTAGARRTTLLLSWPLFLRYGYSL